MGTLLILTPIGADYLYQGNLVSLLAKGQPALATVMDHLNVWYRIFCWLAGCLMALFGMVGAVADHRSSDYETTAEEAAGDEEDEDEDTTDED